MPFPRSLAIALAALALAPATAAANATVTITGTELDVESTAAGEANTISVTVNANDTITVREHNPALDLVAAGDCTHSGDEQGVVVCPDNGITLADARLGPGDDTMRHATDALPRRVEGGAGDDVLAGGAGDDTFVGGADRDLVTYAGLAPGPEDDVRITLHEPDEATPSPGNGVEGEDDRIHSDVEDAAGGPGTDIVTGNDHPNRLTGESLYGLGGADRLDGSGIGELSGGAGDDVLLADNDRVESLIDCGEGSDQLDADNAIDPTPTGCETVAPEIRGTPTLRDLDPVVGGHVNLDLPDVSGTSFDFAIEWYRCGADCTLVASGNIGTYRFEPVDAGQRVFARLHVENAAGEDDADSIDTGVIAAAPVQPPFVPPPPPPVPPGFPPPPPLGYGDYGDYGDYLDPLSQLEDSIAARLRTLGSRFGGRDPRTFARLRAIRHPFAFPVRGTVVITWTARVPAAGVRAAATRPVVLAKGRRRGTKGSTRTVLVRPTRRGRAALRRSRRLTVTMKATFVGGAATRSMPAVARKRFVLRRR